MGSFLSKKDTEIPKYIPKRIISPSINHLWKQSVNIIEYKNSKNSKNPKKSDIHILFTIYDSSHSSERGKKFNISSQQWNIIKKEITPEFYNNDKERNSDWWYLPCDYIQTIEILEKANILIPSFFLQYSEIIDD